MKLSAEQRHAAVTLIARECLVSMVRGVGANLHPNDGESAALCAYIMAKELVRISEEDQDE